MNAAKPNYVLNIENADYSKYVTGIFLNSQLDEASELRVHLAVPPALSSRMDVASISEKARLRVYDRGVFGGNLVDARLLGPSVLELLFTDSVAKLSRTTESDFFKGLTLEEFLRRVAALCELAPRFKGSFSKPLPAFNVLGSSVLNQIQKLSFPYGFHFTARSFASELLFVRLSEFTDSHDLNVLDAAARTIGVRTRQGAGQMYHSAEIRCFDSSTQKSEKAEMSGDQIYAPLGYLKQGRSFSKRLRRAGLGGREERLCTQAKQFVDSSELLSNELSKQALVQDQVEIELWSLPALVGDRLNLKGISNTDAEGGYLVRGLSIEIMSHLPLIKLQLNRG
jgi:hypothetical protein